MTNSTTVDLVDENIESSLEMRYPFSQPISKIKFKPSSLAPLKVFCDKVWEREIKSGVKDATLAYGEQLVGMNYSEIDIRQPLNESGLTSTIAKLALTYLNASPILLNSQKPLVFQDLSFVGAWANLSLPDYDYNPIHMHPNCLLTTVGYLEVPDWQKMLKSQSKEKVVKSGFLRGQPGSMFVLSDTIAESSPFSSSVETVIPAVGDYYIFPATMKHGVYPYPNGYGVRKSFVVNITLNKQGFEKTKIPSHILNNSFGYRG